MSKLTLSVEKSVVDRAKLYAKEHGLSVSAMVQDYLAAVAAPVDRGTHDTPILRSLRGALRKADVKAYRRHLTAKYR